MEAPVVILPSHPDDKVQLRSGFDFREQSEEDDERDLRD